MRFQAEARCWNFFVGGRAILDRRLFRRESADLWLRRDQIGAAFSCPSCRGSVGSGDSLAGCRRDLYFFFWGLCDVAGCFCWVHRPVLVAGGGEWFGDDEVLERRVGRLVEPGGVDSGRRAGGG